MKWTLLPLFLMLALVNCHQPAEQVHIKQYDVPGARSLENALSASFSVQTDASGRVMAVAHLVDEDTLIISAPDSVHRDVTRLIKERSPQPNQAAVQTAVDYWVVLGRKAVGGTSEPMPILPILEKELGTDREYRLLESFRLGSVTGEQATIRGKYFRLHQRVAKNGDRTYLAISFEGVGEVSSSIKTKLATRPGTLQIFGESLCWERFEESEELKEFTADGKAKNYFLAQTH